MHTFYDKANKLKTPYLPFYELFRIVLVVVLNTMDFKL